MDRGSGACCASATSPFFGLGLINIQFALSVSVLGIPRSQALAWSSALLIAGAIAMPLVCYLAAWKMSFRQLFPVPVACLLSAVVILVWVGFLS